MIELILDKEALMAFLAERRKRKMDEMSEKTLTLEEAKVECEIRRLRCLDASTSGYNPAAACAWQDAKAILNRLQPEPDEEGQAVLWLIREKGWAVFRKQSDHRWLREIDFDPGAWENFNPIEEARKLGWQGSQSLAVDNADDTPQELTDHIADANKMVEADGVEWRTKIVDGATIYAGKDPIDVCVHNAFAGGKKWGWSVARYEQVKARGTAPTREEARRQAVEAARGMG